MALRAVALAVALTHSGCAFVASTLVGHGGKGGCVDTPVPGGIDIGISLVTTAGLLASGKAEEQPAWLIIPSVFALSGLIGSISAYSCRASYDGVADKASPQIEYPAVDPTPPDEPSTARDATPEEIGIPPADRPKTDLTLDPDFTPPPEPPPTRQPGR